MTRAESEVDPRAAAAGLYDLEPDFPDDIPFYEKAIPHPDARLLELGCGTGRVLVALADSCGYAHGIDSSEAMLKLCTERLRDAGLGDDRVGAQHGDVTDFDLGRCFDLITAPYRVFQNLETDSHVAGMFRCVRSHLSPHGTFILDAFNPNGDRETLKREWRRPGELFCWEVQDKGETVTCHERRPRIDPDTMILYPELIYRVHRDGKIVNEVGLAFPMRCYYPDELERLVERHGFRIVDRWGGYAGEVYGEGPELLLQLARGAVRDE
jgi:SAM-dependent methyltransferase